LKICLPLVARQVWGFEDLKIESTPKSQIAPKSPKGDFLKLLIFSFPTLRIGVKKIKISSVLTFWSGLKIQNSKFKG